MPSRPGFKQPTAPTADLPVASFRKITDEGIQLEGVHDLQAQSYGCKFGFPRNDPHSSCITVNDPNLEFKRPEAYIRYIGMLKVNRTFKKSY